MNMMMMMIMMMMMMMMMMTTTPFRGFGSVVVHSISIFTTNKRNVTRSRLHVSVIQNSRTSLPLSLVMKRFSGEPVGRM